MSQKSFSPIAFEHEGKQYEAVIPSLRKKGKVVAIEDILENETALNAFMKRAWSGRDEESFNNNGIFRLVFSMENEDEEALDEEASDGEEPSTDQHNDDNK